MMTAMRMRHEIRYGASPADVYAMVSEPAPRQKSCAAIGVPSADTRTKPARAGRVTSRMDTGHGAAVARLGGDR
jgi:hypothetical protein